MLRCKIGIWSKGTQQRNTYFYINIAPNHTFDLPVPVAGVPLNGVVKKAEGLSKLIGVFGTEEANCGRVWFATCVFCVVEEEGNCRAVEIVAEVVVIGAVAKVVVIGVITELVAIGVVAAVIVLWATVPREVVFSTTGVGDKYIAA
jgi:hypothetical protein